MNTLQQHSASATPSMVPASPRLQRVGRLALSQKIQVASPLRQNQTQNPYFAVPDIQVFTPGRASSMTRPKTPEAPLASFSMLMMDTPPSGPSAAFNDCINPSTLGLYSSPPDNEMTPPGLTQGTPASVASPFDLPTPDIAASMDVWGLDSGLPPFGAKTAALDTSQWSPSFDTDAVLVNQTDFGLSETKQSALVNRGSPEISRKPMAPRSKAQLSPPSPLLAISTARRAYRVPAIPVLPSLPETPLRPIRKMPLVERAARVRYNSPKARMLNLNWNLGSLHSEWFPSGHYLNKDFVLRYSLGAQIGAGGFGTVITALERRMPSVIHPGEEYEWVTNCKDFVRDVAVKFVTKSAVPPEQHVLKDGRMYPVEYVVLSVIDHENIVRLLDFYEDDTYWYFVQELHGSPWVAQKKMVTEPSPPPALPLPLVPSPPSLPSIPSTTHRPDLKPLTIPTIQANVPMLSPSSSTDPSSTQSSLSPTSAASMESVSGYFSMSANYSPSPTYQFPTYQFPDPSTIPSKAITAPSLAIASGTVSPLDLSLPPTPVKSTTTLLTPPVEIVELPNNGEKTEGAVRPNVKRRPSHDLFEYIEQHKRLETWQARHIFRQVVQAVAYLDSLGINHRDIKDENLLIDEDLNVKLIDFGSASIRDPMEEAPWHDRFFGTLAFAAPEILAHELFQAPQAEIWTLGVLLAFLLFGRSPFASQEDAKEGIYWLPNTHIDGTSIDLSSELVDLMSGCFKVKSYERWTIFQLVNHPWLFMTD